ncbi:MAG: hypothetical protein ACTS9Y_01125 [Methylophilus sp.]|uniref:hypothetical protein n=1 Tax=Methylophilus sp. TaxID=29541 RepID=UPI003FA1971D
MNKLTKVQQKVLSHLDHGWTTEPGCGMSIHINGQRICNLDTLKSLQKKGLVEQIQNPNGIKLVGQWKAVDVQTKKCRN